MAFRELNMIDVKEVLRRWQAGQSARQIARDGCADRKTVSRYIEASEKLGIARDKELSEELVLAVARRVQIRVTPAPSEEWKILEHHRARIRAWLEGERPLRLVRIGELLKREGVDMSYTTLRRFAHRELGFHERRVTVRVNDSAPGDEAQIDFGEMGFIIDKDRHRKKLWVLIITLTFSRYMFVWPTQTQTLLSLCEGLEAAWQFFEGVIHRIVPDNMSCAVVRAHPMSPTINKSFAEYAQSRGFFIDPARVRRPTDKPRVENQVAYVRERWFQGETFSSDLREIRAHAETWCRDVAGARIHGTTRKIPREVYEKEERAHMLPVPTTPFDLPTWSTAKLHPDHHVQVARSLYSAPTRYIGKTFDVRLDKTSVRLYFGTELIKIHERVLPGKRATDPNDYPVGKADYAFRNVDGLKKRARDKGEHIGTYAERLLSGALPWTKMRQAYGLLRLCDRYGSDRVNSTCQTALAFDVIDVPRIERMLKAAHRVEVSATKEGKVTRLPEGRFAREGSTFSTLSGKPKAEDGGVS